MTWFALQSLFLILGAFGLGLMVGWLVWGRQERQETIVVLHGDGTTRTTTRPVDPASVPAPTGTGAGASPPPSTPPAPAGTPAAPDSPVAPAARAGTSEVPMVPGPNGPEPAWIRAGDRSKAEATATDGDAGPADDADDAATAQPARPRATRPGIEPKAERGTDPDADPPAEPDDAGDGAPSTAAAAAPEVVDVRDTSRVVDLRTDGGNADEADRDDSLERIEGVTPKIAAALHESGIHRYRHLAACDEFRLHGILRSAGLRSVPSLPSWPEQAGLLAEGDADGFAALSARVAARNRAAGTA